MIFKSYSRLIVFTFLFFIIFDIQSAEKEMSSTWRDRLQSCSWIFPTLISSTVIGGLFLYNYIKRSFQKPSEEYLKHIIISQGIIVLEAEYNEKLKKFDELSFNKLINRCIKKGDSAWKKKITPEMLKDLPAKITQQLQRRSKFDNNIALLSQATIAQYMDKNKNLFDDVRLTSVAQEYYRRSLNSIQSTMNNPPIPSSPRGGDYYLLNWGGSETLSDNPVETYKIHLMPKHEDLFNTLEKIYKSKILSDIAIDTKFRPGIVSGKTAGYECPSETYSNKKCLCGQKGTYDIGPIIVIYTSADKTQSLLYAVYSLFKDQEGLNVTPQFNRKITSLIYYAQGNSICKIFNPQHYEQPDLIHYKPEIKSTKLAGTQTNNKKEFHEIITEFHQIIVGEDQNQKPLEKRYHLLHPDSRIILPIQKTYIPTPLAIEEEK